jgi:hypothetical protein
MRTLFWTAAAAAVALVATEAPAVALMIAPSPPGQRAASAEVVVAGKVTSVAKDLVEAPSPFAGATDKQKFQVVTVKIQSGLIGAGKMTEIKVGYIPPPKPDPNVKVPPGGGIRPPIRRGPVIELKEGQELLLFLAKHPKADFYVIPGMNLPIDITNEQGKKELEVVKKVATTLADPMKGLKSDKADVRAETAAIMVTKYRAYPAMGGQTEQVDINADESKLILKALAEGDWTNRGFRFDGPPNPFMAFQSLGLTEKDGWVQPVIVNTPGAPPVDYAAVMKDAYGKWLDGAGKKYVVKKIVAKPAASEK